MKKVYSAPQILFESFTMSTNIAGTCESIVDTYAQGNCAIKGSGNIAIFAADMIGICKFTPGTFNQEEDTWDGFCYHVPTEYNNLFNS